ncbi:U11 U12 small nuclear ribonucleo 65 kDa isoform X1 [Olea europaea subsp. europaea]|uniref:U11 U12 small nuclear ribonucleo 65 kDa isoform X1 n=1 Tax=Olea europaea subsp. europaea TaxID=158383 RepID=A0A8S0QY92_OLEEU|nr:U11 U12 small nuclear ribonucleo 65 kDa isoform X1 [Olea europaea subsp. europaea]
MDFLLTNKAIFVTDFSDSSRRDFAQTGEPMSQRLGVKYPFSPHLEYAYPSPDGNILTNTVNVLIAVTHFYTQALHLMNKMNIPAPFQTALPTPPLPLLEPVPPSRCPPLAMKTDIEDRSNNESERESSDEEVQGEIGPKRKRVKRQAILGPAVDKDVAHEAVGLKASALIPKEKPILKKKKSIQQVLASTLGDYG